MLDRTHIENFLRLNGVSPTAPDEEIKSVLISASWHQSDIDTAITVLRENVDTQQRRVDSLHRVFNTDDRLQPEMVSALLGIEMDVTSEQVALRRSRRNGIPMAEILRLIFISLTLSIISVVVAMWYFEIGWFHQTLR
jgi:hypothetical protein